MQCRASVHDRPIPNLEDHIASTRPLPVVEIVIARPSVDVPVLAPLLRIREEKDVGAIGGVTDAALPIAPKAIEVQLAPAIDPADDQIVWRYADLSLA
jgi:hypothetical protein